MMFYFVSCRWRTQLTPLLEAWDKLASSISANSGVGAGNTGRRGSHGRRYSGSAAAAGMEGEGRKLQPVDSFVKMENEAATNLCDIVTASLGAVKKVRWKVNLDALLLSGRWDLSRQKGVASQELSSVVWAVMLCRRGYGCKSRIQSLHQQIYEFGRNK